MNYEGGFHFSIHLNICNIILQLQLWGEQIPVPTEIHVRFNILMPCNSFLV